MCTKPPIRLLDAMWERWSLNEVLRKLPGKPEGGRENRGPSTSLHNQVILALLKSQYLIVPQETETKISLGFAVKDPPHKDEGLRLFM